MNRILRRYVWALKRYWWVIPLLVVITDGTIYMATRKAPVTTHQATLTILLGSADLTAQQSIINSLSGTLVGYSYLNAINEPTIADQVQQQLHLKDRPTFSVNSTGVLYTLTATGPTVETAKAIALAVANDATTLYLHVVGKGEDTTVTILTNNVAVSQAAYAAASTTLANFEHQHLKAIYNSPVLQRSGDVAVLDLALAKTYATLMFNRDEAFHTYQFWRDEMNKEQVNQLSVQIGQSPTVVGSPVEVLALPSKNSTFLIAGTAASILIALLLILGIDYMDRRVRTPEDAEDVLELPILATVPRVA